MTTIELFKELSKSPKTLDKFVIWYSNVYVVNINILITTYHVDYCIGVFIRYFYNKGIIVSATDFFSVYYYTSTNEELGHISIKDKKDPSELYCLSIIELFKYLENPF